MNISETGGPPVRVNRYTKRGKIGTHTHAKLSPVLITFVAQFLLVPGLLLVDYFQIPQPPKV